MNTSAGSLSPTLIPTADRLLGEPIERGGAVLIPVTRLRRGRAPTVTGAFVLQDGKARWEPAFDLTAVALAGELVGTVALLILWSVIDRRIRRCR